MLFIKFIRGIFKQIKSDLTASQIAIGVFLGTLAGLTPSGPHWIPIFLLALLFNCSMGMMLLCWGLFKLVFLPLAPAAFAAGTSALSGHQGFFPGVAQWLCEAPLLAWLGYDRYLVFGGHLLGLPAAVAVAALAGFSVPRYRDRIAPRIAQSGWYQKIMKVGILRFATNFFFGKDKDPREEKKKRFILLRPFRAYMVIFIPSLIFALVLGTGIYAQTAIKGLAAPMASKALGVQCTFGEVAYAFFGQEFSFRSFQLPDPSDTKQDMIRIGSFETDLGFTDLLSKRFRLEKLVLKDVALSVARKTDGSLNVADLPAAKPDAQASDGEKSAWEEYSKWLHEKGKDQDWSEIWKKYQGYRQKKQEAKKAAEKEEKKAARLPYDPRACWEPRRRIPLFRIDHIEVENLALAVADRAPGTSPLPSLQSVGVKGTRISTMPGWDGEPMRLEGSGKFTGATSGTLNFAFRYLPDRAEGEVKIASIPLADLKPLYEKSLPVEVEKGLLTATSQGSLATGTIDTNVNLRIDQLKIAAKPGQAGILGLDAQTSGYAIQGINAYGEKLPVVVGVAVTGPVGNPSVQGKVPFLEIAKKGLEMLGRQELQKYIDRIGGEVDQLKQKGLEKVVPLQKDFEAVQSESIKALKTGDLTGVQEALRKGQVDAKAVQDTKEIKEDAKKKVDDAKGVIDLFKKKKKE